MGEVYVGSGAGPVGLWLASQIKKRNAQAAVILYERRPEYVRDNQISVHHRSLKKHAVRLHDALEKQTTAWLNAAHETPGALKPLFGRLRRVVRLPARVLEDIFKAEALARGVQIVYQPVELLNQLTRAHPECRYFFGTDGTHSRLRKELLGVDEVALERKPIQASIDVQYLVKGQAQPLRAATYDKCDFMVAESIGKQEKGVSRVGLRFLVDQKTFDSFPEANAASPLGWKEIPDVMKFRILEFQRIRHEKTGEEQVRGTDMETIRASKVQLSCYAAKQFALTQKAQDGRAVGVFFAGNAAMGVPWYQSLNQGL